ncbi:MAG: hypothetical protein AAF367_15020 [Pseudomonadota bacterium]
MKYRTVILIGLLSACGLVPGGFDKSRPVSPVFDVLALASPSGASTEIAVTAFEHDGKAIVCAAAGGGDAGWLETVLNSATIYINGEEIAAGLAFGARYPDQNGLTGSDAPCVETATAWKPDYTGAKARVALDLAGG